MGWDSSRPVDWKQIGRQWVVFAVVFGVIFAYSNRKELGVEMLAAYAVILGLYLVAIYAVTKMGWFQRSRPSPSVEARAIPGNDRSTPSTTPRSKPAPTKRTGGDGYRRSKRRR